MAGTGGETSAQTLADSTSVLSTHGLTKDFNHLRAVDNLDLTVYAGDVFGFLGPTGAGKTTPIRLLSGMQGPVSEERISEVLEMVGLENRGDSKAGSYSHGMIQRLGIALALVHCPDLIVLDEPTSGLDPQGTKDVRRLIAELGEQGTTVFLSSHLLHEVELVCNRAAIMTKGRMIVEGPVSDLHPSTSSVKVLTDNQAKAREVLARLVAPNTVVLDEGYLVFTSTEELVPQAVRRLVEDGLDVLAVVPSVAQGLEDMFLNLTADAGEGGLGATVSADAKGRR